MESDSTAAMCPESKWKKGTKLIAIFVIYVKLGQKYSNEYIQKV